MAQSVSVELAPIIYPEVKLEPHRPVVNICEDDMLSYDPLNWYWKSENIGIFSSAAGTLIDDEHPDYAAWLELGNFPTPWPKDSEGVESALALNLVLAPYGISFIPAGSLAELKTALKIDVDDAAEAERLKYITPGDGQAMTYQQKVTEALAFKASGDAQAEDYPILASEVGITAETLDGVADIVLAAFRQWQLIGAAIEGVRLGAKRDIDAADDEAAARTIVDAIEWPQPAL